MNKKKYLFRLRLELLAAALIALVVAFGVQQLGYYVGIAWVDKQGSSKEYLEMKGTQMIGFLQDYIDESSVKAEDTAKLCRWQRYEKISFSLYDSDTKEMTYFYSFSDEQPLKLVVDDTDYETARKSADAVGVLTFADGEQRNVQMLYDKIYQMYNVAYICSLMLAAICYLIVFMLFINRKIQYIKQLADELKILEGGDLEYEVTEKGMDELSELAAGINSMRKAVVYREKEERENVRRNRDLVTALSHDIRTPMTSLIGYLEILLMQRFQTPQQERRYLESARQKAFQLKEMTDTLFEYSLVSGKTEETYTLEKISVADILVSIEDTQMADLISDGWQIEKSFAAESVEKYIAVDMDFFCRVLDNLVSNIRKYADKSHKLIFTATIKDNCFRLSVSNAVLHERNAGRQHRCGVKNLSEDYSGYEGQF